MKTEVIFVLDKSGSMNSIKGDAIGGYNSFIAEQKKLKDDTTFSLYLFDSNCQKVYESVALDKVEELTENTYVPSSMTALYDAIGSAIENHTEKNKTNGVERTLMVILTDGEENRSKEYTKEAIFNMIEEKKKDDWEFIFLAANQDAMAAARSINISTDNSYAFAATSDGLNSTFNDINVGTRMYRQSANSVDRKLMSKVKSMSAKDKKDFLDNK